MLPIFANLAFNTAPTVFPVSVSVAKNPHEIKTVRSQLDQAELEPGTTKSIFRGASTSSKTTSTMNRLAECSNVANSSGSGRRRSRSEQPQPPSLPQHGRVSRSEETRQPAPPASSSFSAATSATPAFVADWIERMFCCSTYYSGAEQTFDFDEDYENDIVVMDGTSKVVSKASLLNGTPLTERAMDNFPSLEIARELRGSLSDGENPAATTKDASDVDVDFGLKSPKTKFFVLDDKMGDHKARLHFYKQDDNNGMTRTSTATTASASSASVSSASSIQSWNTLPTQPSEDESSCLSAPSQGGNAIKSSSAGRGKRRHQRRLTDPQLAEQFLMQQLREKLMEHGGGSSSTAAVPPSSRPAEARRSKAAPRSVYYQHPQPVE
jgi:hypothetical protein